MKWITDSVEKKNGEESCFDTEHRIEFVYIFKGQFTNRHFLRQIIQLFRFYQH